MTSLTGSLRSEPFITEIRLVLDLSTVVLFLPFLQHFRILHMGKHQRVDPQLRRLAICLGNSLFWPSPAALSSPLQTSSQLDGRSEVSVLQLSHFPYRRFRQLE
jgi:hypothetical protein